MAAFKLTEVKANLLYAPQTFSLAHAVAADFNSVKGSIAWQFSVVFGRIDDLCKQQVDVGSVALLEDTSRFVYFLITKQNIYEYSTSDNLHAALICMREHMRKHNVSKVAMPKLCCGNDRLDWAQVKGIIQNVFNNEHGVEILICDHAPHTPTTPKCQIIEEKGSVFVAPSNFSLVRSVSADFAQGVGLQLKSKLGQVNELMKQNKYTGSVAVIKDGERYIYNLITKERNHEKCTYPALYYALVAMREHMVQHNITKLATLAIGCGIDRLDWMQVKSILEFVFASDNVEIIACHHDYQGVSAGKYVTTHTASCKRSI